MNKIEDETPEELQHLADKVRAVQKLEAALAGWISVKSQTPEPYKQVLAIITYGNGKQKFTLTHWNTRTECFENLLTDNITHWQPLPAPPKTSTCYKDDTKQCNCSGLCRESC